MITLVLHLLRLLPFLLGGHRQLALENLALRQQLAVYKRRVPRPKLRPADRLFWAGLARVWSGWRQALVIVSPDTVLRWQRRRFRQHWTRLSGQRRGGRPPINPEVAALVRTMATANLSFAKTSSARQAIDLSAQSGPQSRLVITLVLHLLRLNRPGFPGGSRP